MYRTAPLRRLLLALVAAAWLAAPAAATNGGAEGEVVEGREEIVLGSKLFTESILLAEMLKQVAEDEGWPASHREQLGGSNILFLAIQQGEIDAYPEYPGTLLQQLLADEELEDLDALRKSLRQRGIQMSASLGFNNTYAIGMREEQAARLGIETISDLRDHPDLRVRVGNEFLDRADGWRNLKAFYDLPQDDVEGIDHDLAYRAIDDGQADVIDLYSTDAEIAFYDLRALAATSRSARRRWWPSGASSRASSMRRK